MYRRAGSAVISSCTISRCSAARTARTGWASRDAYRIVVNRSTKETWFTPDHYVTFYKL